MTRPVLLHYHILKNGGSTIEEILRRSLGGAFFSFDHPDRDAEIKPAELLLFLNQHPEAKAFSSHQIFYPVPQAPGFLFFDICFLRDPFDRIRSIYDYFRGKPAEDDPIRLLARHNSLRDFVRRLIEQMPWTVNDVQVNLLASGLVNDTPRGAEDLERATRRMLETSFLGVVDCFDESLVAGEYAMRTIFPALDCAQERVNDSARPGSTLEDRLERFRVDCGEDVFSELSRLNEMDVELLRRARAEIRRRFEATPGAGERRREIRERTPGVKPRAARASQKISTSAPGTLTRWTRGLRFLADFTVSRAVRRCFDADFYRGSLWDFVTRGAFEGRNPHPLFDTNFYLSQCAERPPENALSHYLKHGGRPHPLFDPEYYTRRYPDVAGARIHPFEHYLLHGSAEGRRPNAWFDPEFYLAACPEARKEKFPLAHFAEHAAANPHPLFDCESYRRVHPEIAANPLADFLARRENPPDLSGVRVVRLEFDEIELPVSLPSSEPRAASGAMVWLDECGRKKFSGPAHLARFLECVRYDQLAAQLLKNPAKDH